VILPGRDLGAAGWPHHAAGVELACRPFVAAGSIVLRERSSRHAQGRHRVSAPGAYRPTLRSRDPSRCWRWLAAWPWSTSMAGKVWIP